ncbi:DUF1217 domain-containing protein [Paracoccus siganidrum]|uniref:DUF1217 domain-containing protein n=1 Tax=Paracoccus siganidrum TaxID=1276757 RepID=A0A419A748_9RHOB|nr:DUF1217 domain-containing protein [Paracoccus siganidrum]RJL16387.1 DUF1217 domain-containing protein [Paracoccus siganidrum]RMC34588.1 hypothetical protein C9E82_11880 [Paracoccus siganidrum]
MIGKIHIGASGIAGWNILKRNEARHLEIVARDPQVTRSTQYFCDNISSAETADQLVGDYRMLSVALGAFGLEADIGNKAFIRKVLESDLSDKGSLANRLGDKRYLRLAEAFGYGASSDARSFEEGFGDRISQDYLQREFERRVGEGDENLRLALNARRELEILRQRDSSDKTLWYEVLGNAPLRSVFEGAFGFGPSYAKLPIDRQHAEFSAYSKRLIGSDSFSDIGRLESAEKIIRNFLLKSEAAASSSFNRFSAALSLLTR